MTVVLKYVQLRESCFYRSVFTGYIYVFITNKISAKPGESTTIHHKVGHGVHDLLLFIHRII